MAHFTHHARDRARERYGVDLSDDDIIEIWTLCTTGKAMLARVSESARIYCLRFRDMVIVPLLTPDEARIVTFLPPEFFNKGNNLKYQTGIGRIKPKQKAAAPRGGCNADYRRERIRVRDVLDDL